VIRSASKMVRRGSKSGNPRRLVLTWERAGFSRLALSSEVSFCAFGDANLSFVNLES
jgi:hypothetical protein